MKTSGLLAVVVLLAASQVHGQVVLNAGESLTHQFSTLPFNDNLSFGIPGPSGALFLYLIPPAGPGPASSYRVELFENTPADPPVLVAENTIGPGGSGGDYRAPNAWGDLQGSFRVTALTGSITVRGFSLQSFRPGTPTGFDVYSTDRIYFPTQPVLSVMRANDGFALYWPAAATNFILQATASLIPPVMWSPVTNAVTLNGNVFSVTLAPSGTNDRQFFRLRYEP